MACVHEMHSDLKGFSRANRPISSLTETINAWDTPYRTQTATNVINSLASSEAVLLVLAPSLDSFRNLGRLAQFGRLQLVERWLSSEGLLLCLPNPPLDGHWPGPHWPRASFELALFQRSCQVIAHLALKINWKRLATNWHIVFLRNGLVTQDRFSSRDEKPS